MMDHGTTHHTEDAEQLRPPRPHVPRAAAALSVTAVAALALSACGPDDELNGEDAPEDVTVELDENTEQDSEAEQDAEDDQSGSQDTGTDQESVEGQAADDDPLYEAVEAVLAEHPEAVFTEFDDEGSSYEFILYDGETERELEVDAESFDIIATEDDSIDADDREKAETVEIEFADALRTAADQGGAVATDAELDTVDGTVVYEIELQNDSEVSVDATTGDVVDR